MQQRTQQFRDWLERLYQRAFRPQLDTKTHEIAQALRGVPLLSEFNRRKIRSFAESLHVRDYKRDEYIYRERDPGLGMYIVKTGRVRLLTEDEEGNLYEATQVGDGEIFGQLALLGDFRRFETAQAMTETSVFGFFRPELKAMIKRDPRTAVALLNLLAGRTADEHVALYNLLVEKEGKVLATRMHGVAARRVETPAPDASFVVRP